MKKFFAFLAVCVLSLFTLCSCSSAGKIQKAFEKEGWTVVSETIDNEDSVLKGVYTCKNGLKFAFFFELGTTDDLESAISELQNDDNTSIKNAIKLFGEDAKAVAKALKDQGLVNGNCILVSLDLGAKEIFSKA